MGGSVTKASNVSGVFYVTMSVEDHSSALLSQIATSTSNARHVIRVENISSLTQNAKVIASLPNGTRSIQFTDPGGGVVANWDETRHNIPSGAIVICDRPLTRNGGPKNAAEPIRAMTFRTRSDLWPGVRERPAFPFR